MKYAFKIVLCRDTCELICFKLSVMLNTTKLYILMQFGYLDVHSRFSVARELELVPSLCCKIT